MISDSPASGKSRKFEPLSQWRATAICGNDILSSCLYVSALAIIQAGVWAPLVLLLVAGVLYLFRSIYGEVVGALPLNGGAYNALLNTTSKGRASLAACLTILSYMATAVISANEAIHYLHSLWSTIPLMQATVFLLFLFMILTILGISESATVALFIFIFHVGSLIFLLVVGGLYILNSGFDILATNFATPPTVSLKNALFFGFAASMLGISGFESSSNFVEEQAPGVFPKTLRNMWVGVSIFNPLIALLALAIVPIVYIPDHKEALLAHVGSVVGGPWLAGVVCVDAVLVLSGAVLTSFVGVTGLVRRMTLDRCMPQSLLKTNRRGTPHRIILSFFILCASILVITKGELSALAGVYTISFLAVMALFASGNILLKVRRARLPRPEKASWSAVLIGLSAVVIGLLGNMLLNPAYFRVFMYYFVPTILLVSIMLNRIVILRTILFVVKSISKSISGFSKMTSKRIEQWIEDINSLQVVFFTRGDNIANLNEAMMYVVRNEHSSRIKIVTVVQDDSEVPDRLPEDIRFLDEAYPNIDVEFCVLHDSFGPELVYRLSDDWKVPRNYMFIGSPGDHFPYQIADLGGVRLII